MKCHNAGMESPRVIHDMLPAKAVWDITGPETLLLLLPCPGDEAFRFGGLIAELCARGRPPFVVVIGDGAPDSSAAVARQRERAVRGGCAILGLPNERLLFAGLRQGRIPGREVPLFNILKAAMTQISWRYDCNVIGTVCPDVTDGDDYAVFTLALAIAGACSLALIAAAGADSAPLDRPDRPTIWTLDISRWAALKRRAAALHEDRQVPGRNVTERFLRWPADMDDGAGE